MPKTPLTVLVADDSRDSRQIASRMLEAAGYRCVEAEDGTSALRAALSPGIDLVLLDVSMPDLDGFEVCQLLRAQRSAAELPVIFLTGRTEDQALARGFEVGGNDYVLKPINKPVLLARISAQVRALRTSRALSLSYDRLAQQRRMEMLGTFAAGVAHNFNNVLGTVLGSAELIDLYTRQRDKRVSEAAAMIVEAAKKGAALTASLMALARPDETADCSHPLSIARSAVNLASQLADRLVCLELTHEGTIPDVQISPKALSQILLELLKNSIEALPDQGCVSLHLVADLEEPPAPAMVRFIVKDTGGGISAALLDRIFTPFVSTKRADSLLGIALDGSGLGLSIVSSLVAAAGGTISVAETNASGTTIEVRLPVSHESHTTLPDATAHS